jgi:hypothetical protein
MLQKLWNCWQPYQPCRTTLRRSSLPTTKRATPSWVLCCRITMPSIRSPWSPAVRHHGILWEIVWNRHGDMVNVGGLWVCSRLQNLKFGPLNFGSELIHPFKIIKIMCLRLSIQSHNGTSWYVLVRPGTCSFQLKDADHQQISAQSLLRNVHISSTLWREFSWGKGTYLVHTWRRSELDLCCYAQGGLPLGKRMGNVEGCQVRVRLGLEVGPPKRQNQDESGWIENSHTVWY